MYRVREKFSHPLVLQTSTIIIKINLVVQKSLAQNSKLKNNQEFHVFNHIITLVNCFWLKPKMELLKTNENDCGMVKLKGIFNLILSSTRFAFMTFKMNFTVIWRQFSAVSLFFLIKNVLVPQKSHVKGIHVWTKFLPVPDNRT